jgi:hypothetical protein
LSAQSLKDAPLTETPQSEAAIGVSLGIGSIIEVPHASQSAQRVVNGGGAKAEALQTKAQVMLALIASSESAQGVSKGRGFVGKRRLFGRSRSSICARPRLTKNARSAQACHARAHHSFHLERLHRLFHLFRGHVGGGLDALDLEFELVGIAGAAQRLLVGNQFLLVKLEDGLIESLHAVL